MDNEEKKVEMDDNKEDVSLKIDKIECDDIKGKFLLVRVGDNNRPATEEEINEVSEKLESMFEENGINCLTLVTHHAVDISIIR